jgi:hypothetical protein
MPDRRTLDAAAYSAAMAAALLILFAAYMAAKRERELAAYAGDCEKDLRQLRESKRQVEGEVSNARAERDRALEGVPALPTDALVIVTNQGYVCPTLDHPAGSRASSVVPSEEACEACDRYLDHYDPGHHNR